MPEAVIVATARTPIIVLSGNEDADTRTRALAAGADDYLVKLPSKADLLACLRRHAAGGTHGIEPTFDRAAMAGRIDEIPVYNAALSAVPSWEP